MADVEVQTNLNATVAPTVTDDEGAGWSVFSPWVDIVADRVYFCADTARGAAVWRQVIGGSVAGGANNEVLTNDGAGGLVSESGLIFDGTNLGIGTSTPNWKVEIVDGSLETLRLQLTNPFVNGFTEVVLENDVQSWKMQLAGTSDQFQIRNTTSAVQPFVIDSGSRNVQLQLLATESVFNVNGFDLNFRVRTDNLSQALYVDGASGNVGIGIANQAPSAQLAILAGASTVGINLDLNPTPGDAITVTDSGSNVLFVVDGTGKVGVGTDSPSGRVVIKEAEDVDALSFDVAGTERFAFQTHITGPDYFTIRNDADGGNLMVWMAGGNVGIGMTAVNERLQVDDAIAISSDAEGSTARLTRRTSHETHTLAAAATSDTTTISIPSGARLLAVSSNVNTAVVDDGGDDTWSMAFITGSTTTLATAAAAAQNTKVDLMLPDEISTGICQIRFTANGGSFTAGIIEIVAYYEELTSLANV